MPDHGGEGTLDQTDRLSATDAGIAMLAVASLKLSNSTGTPWRDGEMPSMCRHAPSLGMTRGGRMTAAFRVERIIDRESIDRQS